MCIYIIVEPCRCMKTNWGPFFFFTLWPKWPELVLGTILDFFFLKNQEKGRKLAPLAPGARNTHGMPLHVEKMWIVVVMVCGKMSMLHLLWGLARQDTCAFPGKQRSYGNNVIPNLNLEPPVDMATLENNLSGVLSTLCFIIYRPNLLRIGVQTYAILHCWVFQFFAT